MEVIRGMWNGHEVLFFCPRNYQWMQKTWKQHDKFPRRLLLYLTSCHMNSKNMDRLHTLRVVKDYQCVKIIHVNQVQILLQDFRTPLSRDKWRKTSQRRPGKRHWSVLTQLLEAKWTVFIIPVIPGLPKQEKTTSHVQTANNELLSTDCWTVRLSVEQQRSESKFRFGNWKRNSSGALTMPNAKYMQIVGNDWCGGFFSTIPLKSAVGVFVQWKPSKPRCLVIIDSHIFALKLPHLRISGFWGSLSTCRLSARWCPAPPAVHAAVVDAVATTEDPARHGLTKASGVLLGF